MSLRHVLAFLFVFLLPATAAAHFEVTDPPPRYDRDDVKGADAPCGGVRQQTQATLVGGDDFMISWHVSIHHDGYFRVQFSEAGDTNWQLLADNITDDPGQDDYTETVTVPDVTCTDCTFRAVQVMEDRNPPSNYYSCIDVEVTASGGDAGMVAGDDAGTTSGDDAGTMPGDDAGTVGAPDAGGSGGGNMGGGGGEDAGGAAGEDAGSGGAHNIDAGGRACAVVVSRDPSAFLPGLLALISLVLVPVARRRFRGTT